MSARGGITVLLGFALIAWIPSPAAAASLSFGPTAGVSTLDRDLDNYRWDLGPHAVFGAEARARHGRWTGGLRLLRSATDQATGIPGDARAPRVRLTSLELVAEARLASAWGLDVVGTGHGGRLHLGYDPDRLTFDVGGTPLSVDYEPVDEWIGGLGLGLRRTFPVGLEVGLTAEHSMFGLDTAHRNGDEIERRRETFHNWSLQVQLAWRFWDR